MTQSKCYLYCNGLMDHVCSCNPEDPNSKWLQRPGHFNGTIVSTIILNLKIKFLDDQTKIPDSEYVIKINFFRMHF